MAKDSKILIEHLVAAERHVTLAQEQIKRQRGLIEVLRADGHDTEETRALLLELEKCLLMHETDRDRLRGELGLEMVPPA